MRARLLSTRDVMNRLGFAKEDSVYALVKSGQLPAYKIAARREGRARYRFEDMDVERFLQGTCTGGQAPAQTRTPATVGAGVRFIDRTRKIKRLPPSL